MITNKEKICQFGKTVITEEAKAVANLAERIDEKFVKACNYLINCEGRIIVMGMGKSGHIASKLAATFASTGSPAFFLHPAEASHGDIGTILKRDVVLAISNSGNTPEILAILPTIKRLNVPLISMTGNLNSVLANKADVNLDVSVTKEACPLGLAPTSSTTATLAMGDALAIALLKMRGFTSSDFARSHPGGVLGKRLSLLVDDIMHTGEMIPKVSADESLLNALVEITQKRLGMTTVVAIDGKLLGIFTDGDLRRVLDQGLNVANLKMQDVLIKNCKTIELGTLAIEALQIMEQYKITTLVVVENHCPVGVVHIHDLLQVGL
jgi:arabinose-5-phosphate isomerase